MSGGHTGHNQAGHNFNKWAGDFLTIFNISITPATYSVVAFPGGPQATQVIDYIDIYCTSGAIQIETNGSIMMKSGPNGKILYPAPHGFHPNGHTVDVVGITVGADGPVGDVMIGSVPSVVNS